MWIEKRSDHFRMYERYVDPITLKKRKVSVKMKKNTPQERNKAQAALDELIVKRMSYSSDVSFRTLTQVYLASKKSEVKESTHRRNERECKILIKILGGDVKVEAFTAGYVKTRIQKHNSKPSTVNEHIQRFKEIIKWGYQNNLVGDISFLMKLTKLKDKSERQKVKDKFLEADECVLLLAAMKPNWRSLAEFMIQSGLRVGEALAVEVGDIDFESRKIRVNKNKDVVTQKIDTPKTAASIREVYMQDDLYDLCKRIVRESEALRRENKVNTLFFSRYETPADYAGFNVYLGRISEQVLGRRITTHVLRHTHASLLAEQENLPDNELMFEMIQKRLGHENSRITKEIYVHVTKRLEQRFEGMTKGVHLLDPAPKLPPTENAS